MFPKKENNFGNTRVEQLCYERNTPVSKKASALTLLTVSTKEGFGKPLVSQCTVREASYIPRASGASEGTAQLAWWLIQEKCF